MRIRDDRTSYHLFLLLIIPALALAAVWAGIIGWGRGTAAICFDFAPAANQAEHLFWTLINATLLGAYINTLGLFSSKRSWTRYPIFVVLLAAIILGISFPGLRIELNIPFPLSGVYESNSPAGVAFLVRNAAFLLSLFMISFLTEGNE